MSYFFFALLPHRFFSATDFLLSAGGSISKTRSPPAKLYVTDFLQRRPAKIVEAQIYESDTLGRRRNGHCGRATII